MYYDDIEPHKIAFTLFTISVIILVGVAWLWGS